MRFIAMSFFLLVCGPNSVLAQQYTLVDLGFLGYGRDVNNLGWVAGENYRWTPGSGAEDVGTFGGPTFVKAINNVGTVAGHSYLTGGNIAHAFTWTPLTGLQDLGTLGGTFSAARDINDLGQVTGGSYLLGGTVTTAFVWTAATGMQSIGTLPGGSSSESFGINASGQVAGYSFVGGNAVHHAYRYSPDQGMVDLGTIGGSSSEGYGINDSGQVAGFSFLPGDTAQRAVIWTPKQEPMVLGTLGGVAGSGAWAINNLGHIVGVADTPGGDLHGIFWSPSSGLRDLNELIQPGTGMYLQHAFSISDTGYITGGAIDGVGLPHAVLLIPAAVPEPSALVLGATVLMSSLGVYWVRNRRKARLKF